MGQPIPTLEEATIRHLTYIRPVASVIHRDGHLARHDVQRQRAGLKLAQAEKARRPAGLALVTVVAIAGASIPALWPALPLRFLSVIVRSFCPASWLLPRLMVVLRRRGTVTPLLSIWCQPAPPGQRSDGRRHWTVLPPGAISDLQVLRTACANTQRVLPGAQAHSELRAAFRPAGRKSVPMVPDFCITWV